MASDRRGLVVDDLVLRLLRASAGVVMVALLVSGGTGVAVGGSSPDPRESVHSPPVVDLAENVATDTRTQRADDCRAPLQQPSAVESDVVCAYDYRPDFARPPPDDAAAYAYDTAANSAEPAGSLGRVRRVLSGLVLDRVAPNAPGVRVGMQTTGRAPSSAVLGDNLVASGVARPANSAAHHIVAGGSQRAAPARAALDRFGIDINRSANGVFLPANRAVPNPSGSAVHSTLHTNRYYDEVNRLLGGATTRQEALDVLDYIRGELVAGRGL